MYNNQNLFYKISWIFALRRMTRMNWHRRITSQKSIKATPKKCLYTNFISHKMIFLYKCYTPFPWKERTSGICEVMALIVYKWLSQQIGKLENKLTKMHVLQLPRLCISYCVTFLSCHKIINIFKFIHNINVLLWMIYK